MTRFNFISDVDNYESHFVNFIDGLLVFMYSEIHKTNQHHDMIDIGACKGKITKILLNHIDPESGKVIAIDAHPNWLNTFEYVNDPLVENYNVGCYSSPAIKKFVAEDRLTGRGFIGAPPDKNALNLKKLKTFQVECNKLDNLIDSNRKISFIKIDAESSDFEIILGAKNIIENHRPFIVFEFSGQIMEKSHLHTREDFFDFFKSIKYNLYSVGLGRSEEYLSNLWDVYTAGFKDILAVPGEYAHLIDKELI